MNLSAINEGAVTQAGARIVDVKNKVARALASHLNSMGHRPEIDYANDASDEVIVYAHIGKIIGKNQTLMIRVITDTDIQIQIPTKLAAMLGVQDYHNTGSVDEAGSVLNRIINAAHGPRESILREDHVKVIRMVRMSDAQLNPGYWGEIRFDVDEALPDVDQFGHTSRPTNELWEFSDGANMYAEYNLSVMLAKDRRIINVTKSYPSTAHPYLEAIQRFVRSDLKEEEPTQRDAVEFKHVMDYIHKRMREM